jgi:hypothetical protein
MSEYISKRQRKLNIGISSYTENTTVSVSNSLGIIHHPPFLFLVQ